MTQPADIQQRRDALDPTRSFAVAAPAGSGKTGLLTQRVLTLLATCAKPEEVLAITFTRKAAAEMRHRIISALRRATDHTPPEDDYQQQTWQLARAVLERDLAHNWQLLSAPNRLQIQTIDGLCRNLARQLVLENGLGELPQPSENTEPVYRQTVQDFLKRLEQDDDTGRALATLLQHLDNNLLRVERLLVSLLARREQWLGPILNARDSRTWLEQHLTEVVTETLSDAAGKLQTLAGDLTTLLDYAANQLTHSNPDHPFCQFAGIRELPDTGPDFAYLWQVLIDLLLTQKGEWRKTIDVRSGFPAGKGEAKARKQLWAETLDRCREIPGLAETLMDIRYLPYATYPDQQWHALQALTTILPQLGAELSVQFLANNQCDFTEITFAALRSLGEPDNPTETALRLDYRINHILVDEFQDTSSIQFQLLGKLTAEWQPGDGRTLFIVGDGMQSLYGFRSANVGLFLEARRHPIGAIDLEPLDLSVNFRSQQNLVSWINRTFQSAFPQADDIGRGAVRYSEANAFKPELPGPGITLDAFVDLLANEGNRAAEAEQVVAHIRTAQRERPDDNIAVLVRNRGHLNDILPALYQAGLNWQALDIEPLSDRMAVIDAHSLTRALLSYADRIAWLSVLRAPWCGLDLHDLHALANTELADNPVGGAETWPLLWPQLQQASQIADLSDDGKQILQRVTPVLAAGLAQRGRKPLRSWVEGIWVALGGPAALADPNDLQHVRSYFDLLEQHSRAGAIEDPGKFAQAVSRLYATPPASSDARLQLMTIHKSKGLEFDTVIIPGLDRPTRSNDSAMLLWRERVNQRGQAQLLLGPLQASGDDQDTLFEHLKYENRQKNRLENARVIYVGATRAVKKLHLLFQVKTDSRGNHKTPATDSLLAPLWEAIAPQLRTPDQSCRLHHSNPATQSDEPETPSITCSLRLPADWQAAQITTQKLLLTPQEQGRDFSDTESWYQDESNARHIGTVLHRTFEQIVYDGADRWQPERIERQRPFWQAQLRQLGVADTDIALALLERAITQALSDPKGIWLLDNSHGRSACELPLGFIVNSSNGRQRKAIIDRTFVADGVRWIIDYKSAQPDANQSLDAFIKEQKERYTPQLQAYATLMAQMESLPIRTALYFPLVPHLAII